MLNHSRRGTLVLLFALAAAAALGQSGCTTLSEWYHNGFKVGPNYEAPPAPLPGSPALAARRTRATAWSMSKGLGRYSNAPPS